VRRNLDSSAQPVATEEALVAACKVDSKADMEVRPAVPKAVAAAAAAAVKFTWLTFVPVRHRES
jgi:hypothetical protein